MEISFRPAQLANTDDGEHIIDLLNSFALQINEPKPILTQAKKHLSRIYKNIIH